jgi:hypothetical protein
MTRDGVWPDWQLNPDSYRTSMQNLARYVSPAQLRGLGLGLRALAGEFDYGSEASVGATASQVEHARGLAEVLAARDVSYALEPFNPSVAGGQIVRTTSELLEGRQGTCLDFAVSLAALCVQARIPVTLAVALPNSRRSSAHAFVLVQQVHDSQDDPPGLVRSEIYSQQDFRVWEKAFREKGQFVEHHLIDPTPLQTQSYAGTLDERNARTLDWLSGPGGVVYTVAVQHALLDLGISHDESPFFELPRARRDLGLTAWLPDLPQDVEPFPSREARRSELPVEGSAVIVGPKGAGKSTLALLRAQQTEGGRGWFLDGSDRTTLLRSLASAEAQCRGTNPDNDQSDNLVTLAARARDRLARTGRPWVVVIDNADAEPGDIMDLLPVPGTGQLVIVTSTEPSWTARPGWRAVQLSPLERTELSAADQRLALADDELLPGLIRIARHCDPDVLASSRQRAAGPKRLIAALLVTMAQAAGDSGADVEAAMTAASFMPAEEVTVGWLAEAQFDGDVARTERAVQHAAQLGLLEYSRRSLGPRDDTEAPLWMHRLLRTAVRELREEPAAETGFRVLASHKASHRLQRYSETELDELNDFLRQAADSHHSHLFAQAAAAVMDMLEPRGRKKVNLAGELAAMAQPVLDRQAADYVDLICTFLMARARVVSHDADASIEDIEKAITLCLEAVAVAPGVKEYLLLRGRAEAMRGILLRKLASRKKDATSVTILEEAIEVLWKSYEERKLALSKDPEKYRDDDPTKDTLLPDPDRHVDRAWFNLGGAYIALAQLIRHESPQRLPEIFSKSLWAYMGSLSLRRSQPGDAAGASEDTLYTAASYYGVALALYMAAVHCPGQLDLDAVAAAAELDPVRRDQTRETLLRAAEITAARSTDIRADIDGPTGRDTWKSRQLHTKIELAWGTPGQEWEVRLKGLKATLKPFLSDLDLTLGDPPDDQPREALVVTYARPKAADLT